MKKWIGIVVLIGFMVLTLEAYLMTKWFAGEALEKAYVTEHLIKEGDSLTLKDFKLLYIKEGTFGDKLITDLTPYLGKPMSYELPKGKILTEEDFTRLPGERANLCSLVVRLNQEQAHGGQFTAGELVNVVCYNQGSVKQVEDLMVQSVEGPQGGSPTEDYFLTLTGNEASVQSIYLAKIEGNITIVKKLTGK